MTEKSHPKLTVQEEILFKIRSISEDLTQATEDCGITEQQLIAELHRQTRELARVFHLLCHLQSEKEGKR